MATFFSDTRRSIMNIECQRSTQEGNLKERRRRSIPKTYQAPRMPKIKCQWDVKTFVPSISLSSDLSHGRPSRKQLPIGRVCTTGVCTEVGWALQGGHRLCLCRPRPMAPARTQTRRSHREHNSQSLAVHHDAHQLPQVEQDPNEELFLDPMMGTPLSLYVDKDVDDRDQIVEFITVCRPAWRVSNSSAISQLLCYIRISTWHVVPILDH